MTSDGVRATSLSTGTNARAGLNVAGFSFIFMQIFSRSLQKPLKPAFTLPFAVGSYYVIFNHLLLFLSQSFSINA